MFPGAITMGAQDRLLPPSVPYSFFATAVVFHLAAWACLALADPAEAVGFLGGPGPVLAALHLITLGVLAMTALGAAMQLLPMATRRPLGSPRLCRITYWLYAPGVAVLTAGFWLNHTALQHAGACLAVAGLALFGVMAVGNLRKVDDLPGVTRHVWLALASLLGLAVLGLLLIVDFTAGLLPDHTAAAAAHAVLAGYGFMGMLAMGFSYVLIPMFVLGQPIPAEVGKKSALLAGIGLALGVVGALTQGWVAALGGVAGLAAAAVQYRGVRACLKTRMRKKLETFFRMVWVAGAMLPLSLLVGIAVALGAPGSTLWAFLLVFGWLLSFVTGILQRIMPFLASMHSSLTGGKPALLSALTPTVPLTVHYACHVAALLLLAAAILTGWAPLFGLGAWIGLAGSIAFVAFAFDLWRRWRRHLALNPPQAK